MLTWSCSLLMTAALNKKKDAALFMVTLVFTRSSLADAAFEYFIWLTEPQHFPIYFLTAFGKNVKKMPEKANAGWSGSLWRPSTVSQLEHPDQGSFKYQPARVSGALPYLKM